MRWLVLFTYLLALLLSLIAPFLLAYLTRSVIPLGLLAFPGLLLKAMHPIIRYLFDPPGASGA